jgi:hypothetical protein
VRFSGYLCKPMNEEDARAIAAWHYPQSTNGGEHPFLLMPRQA